MKHVSQVLRYVKAVAMLDEVRETEKIAKQQNARVGSVHLKKCEKPCKPVEWFATVEECEICKRKF